MENFLQEVVTDFIDYSIKIGDYVNLDIHFLRYFYLALFENRKPDLLHNKII